MSRTNTIHEDACFPYRMHVTRKQLAAFLEEASQEYQRAWVKYAGAEEVFIRTRMITIFHELWDKGISAGSEVVVRFYTGDGDTYREERAIFEGLVDDLDRPILIRYVTAKGKPGKQTHYLEACSVKNIRPYEPKTKEGKKRLSST